MPNTAITAIIVGLVVTAASAIVPAIRATRVPPIAALRAVITDIYPPDLHEGGLAPASRRCACFSALTRADALRHPVSAANTDSRNRGAHLIVAAPFMPHQSADRAQTAYDDLAADADHEVAQQAAECNHLDVGMLAGQFLGDVEALFDGEHRALVVAGSHRHDQSLEQPTCATHEVLVAECHRIERAGIDPDAMLGGGH